MLVTIPIITMERGMLKLVKHMTSLWIKKSPWKTKTGIFTNSETNQELKVDICSDNGQCCTTDRLDNPGQEFQRGKLDTFEGSVLGQCSNYNLNGLSKVQVKLSGTDGWYGTFLKVYLNNDIIYHCPINQWIDNSSILRLHCSLFDF